MLGSFAAGGVFFYSSSIRHRWLGGKSRIASGFQLRHPTAFSITRKGVIAMRKSATTSRWNRVRSFMGIMRRGGGGGIVRQKRRQLAIEPLEERSLLSVCTWTGGGGSNDTRWSNSANWSGDPTAGNAALVFQGTPVNTVDNLTGIAFQSITFESNGFSVSASSGNNIVVTDGIVMAADVTSATISADVVLGGSLTADVADSSGVLTICRRHFRQRQPHQNRRRRCDAHRCERLRRHDDDQPGHAG